MNIVKDFFKYYLVIVCIGFIAGLMLSYYLSPLILFHTLVFCLIILLALFFKLIICFLQKKKYKKSFTVSIIFIIPLLIGGLRLYFWNYESLNILRSLENDKALYTAKITSIPEKSAYYETFSADALIFRITNDKEETDVNINIKLRYKEIPNEHINFGDTVKFYTAYESEENPYSIYQKSKNQATTLSAPYCIKTDVPAPKNFLSDLGVKLRDKALTATDTVYSYNSESAAIVKAILTGDKNDFSDSLYDDLADAGFLHVAAISGTHVSILFSILSVLLLSLRIKKSVTVIVSALAIIIFSSVSAFTPSVLRASIMIIFSMFSIFASREYDSFTALFASALIILIIYPYALFTAGFLLSFGATLGIILYNSYFLAFFKKIFSKLSYILPSGSIALSAAAFLGTIPFTLLFFGRLSFWSLITNIWIVPMVYFIFCLGLISSIFYYICPPIAYLARYLNEPLVYTLIKTGRTFAGMEFGILTPDYIPWSFYLYYIAFLFILIYLFKSKKEPA